MEYGINLPFNQGIFIDIFPLDFIPDDEKQCQKFLNRINSTSHIFQQIRGLTTLVQCGVNVTGTYLVTLNSDYVRQGDLDVQQLFNIIDMKELVENVYFEVFIDGKTVIV